MRLTPDRDKLTPIVKNKYQPISMPEIDSPGYNAALSQDQQTPTDTIGQVYRANSVVRLSPLPASANASVNAVANSSATRIVNQAIANIPPTPPQPATGDGLIHGDTIWEIDPAYNWIRDDFLMVEATSAINGSFRSQVPWYYSGPNAFQFAGIFPYTGTILIPNNATASNAGFLLPEMAPGGGQGCYPLFDYPNWKLIWNFSLGRPYRFTSGPVAFSMAQTSMYIGLAMDVISLPPVSGSASVRPPFFCGLRFDTDTTAPAISDTVFMFETVGNNAGMAASTRVNTQGSVSSTGIAPAEGVNYRLEIQYTGGPTVKLTLIGGGASATANLPVPTWSTGSSGNIYLSNNGLALINTLLPSFSTADTPVGSGSIFTVIGTSTPFDGAHVALGANAGFLNYAKASNAGSAQITSTISGNAAMIPWVAFGNDTTAGPTANSKAILVDFCSFVWNPGVGGGTATPNSSLSRYF